MNKAEPRALFAEAVFGFLTLEAGEREVSAHFYDVEAKEMYAYTIKKGPLAHKSQ